MSIPTSPRNADWRPARVPKLGYRKPLPPDELDKLNAQVLESTPNASNISRMDSTYSSATKSIGVSTIAPPAKKKASFLGSLFAKEPTLTALAQVEAELKAKHGAATAQSVPHVSSRKMPEHVPKVNSKWDGVPEAVKTRDREEKQRRRMSQRYSFIPPHSARSECTDDSGREMQHDDRDTLRVESDAGSQSDSWREQDDVQYPRRGSTNSASSSDSHGVNTFKNTSTGSTSLRSSSGTNLAGITAFFAHQEQQARPIVSQKLETINYTVSNRHVRPSATHHTHQNPPVDIVPDHSASPINTPGEMSPVTPSYLSDHANSPVPNPLQSAAAATRIARHAGRSKPVPIDAFLAGEAKPLQLDGDEDISGRYTDLPLRQYSGAGINVPPAMGRSTNPSRARPGMKGAVSANIEATPWELEGSPVPNLSSPAGSSAKSRVPKGLAILK